MIRCLFLDFDGVVVESSMIKTRAFLDLYFDASSTQLEAIKRYHLQNFGVSRYQKFNWIEKNIFGTDLSLEKSQRLGKEFSKLVFDAIVNAPLVSGALELLEEARGNIPVYLISGTPQLELELIVDRMGLTKYFTAVYGTPAQKDQTIERLLLHHSLTPKDSCFIGDGPTDYDAAVATGVKFIARDSGEHKEYWQSVSLNAVIDLRGLNLDVLFLEGITVK